MSFFSEIAGRAGLSELALLNGFNTVNYNGECVYVEGVKRLFKISEEEIVLELRGAVLTLRGEGLTLFELSDAAIVKGFVAVTELVKTNNKGARNGKSKTKQKTDETKTAKK